MKTFTVALMLTVLLGGQNYNMVNALNLRAVSQYQMNEFAETETEVEVD